MQKDKPMVSKSNDPEYKQFGIYIRKDLHTKLKIMSAASQGVSMRDIVEEHVEDYIKTQWDAYKEKI